MKTTALAISLFLAVVATTARPPHKTSFDATLNISGANPPTAIITPLIVIPETKKSLLDARRSNGKSRHEEEEEGEEDEEDNEEQNDSASATPSNGSPTSTIVPTTTTAVNKAASVGKPGGSVVVLGTLFVYQWLIAF